MADFWSLCQSTSGVTAEVAEPGCLRLLVPIECGGKLIGRRGARIKEVQYVSGAHVQVTDRDDQKLVEISGSAASVAESVKLVTEDVMLSEQRLDVGVSEGHVMLSVLVPEVIVGWAMNNARRCSGSLSVEILASSWDASERRMTLRGDTTVVHEFLHMFFMQICRAARWTMKCILEIPWDSCDVLPETDPADDFVSAQNLLVVLPEGAVDKLVKGGSHATLIAQIQEETGSIIRVRPVPQRDDAEAQPTSWPMLELAGNFGAKVRAMAEVSLLVTLLAECLGTLAKSTAAAAKPGDTASHVLEIWFPSGDGSSLSNETLLSAAAECEVSVSIHNRRRQHKTFVATRLTGRRGYLCEAVVRVVRAFEGEAARHCQKHGPPLLLVDYLLRWFGRDAQSSSQREGIYPGSNRNGPRTRQPLPKDQIASANPLRAVHNPNSRPREKSPSPCEEFGPSQLGPQPDAEVISAPAEVSQHGEVESAAAARPRKRRKLRLPSPFRTGTAFWGPANAENAEDGNVEAPNADVASKACGYESDDDSDAAVPTRAESLNPQAGGGDNSENADEDEDADVGGDSLDPLWEMRQKLLSKLGAP